MRSTLRFPLNYLCLPIVLLSYFASIGSCGIIWDEFTAQGDLSGVNTSPTPLTLSGGSNIVRGFTTNSPLDRDFFTVGVGPGQFLDSITLNAFSPAVSSSSFFAVQSGSQVTSISSSTALLGSALVSTSLVGTDVLDNLGVATLPGFGKQGIGFTGPLGPGTYTFWFQETNTNINNYEFNLNVSPIPEPGSLMLLTVGLIVSGKVFGRKRRK